MQRTGGVPADVPQGFYQCCIGAPQISYWLYRGATNLPIFTLAVCLHLRAFVMALLTSLRSSNGNMYHYPILHCLFASAPLESKVTKPSGLSLESMNRCSDMLVFCVINNPNKLTFNRKTVVGPAVLKKELHSSHLGLQVALCTSRAMEAHWCHRANCLSLLILLLEAKTAAKNVHVICQ